MKTRLVISRQWDNPQIRAFVSQTEVGAEIELDDYIDAIVEQIGNPTLMVTKAGLKEKIRIASEAVLAELRKSTAHVV